MLLMSQSTLRNFESLFRAAGISRESHGFGKASLSKGLNNCQYYLGDPYYNTCSILGPKTLF